MIRFPRKGFSLIELLAVMAIIVILLAFVAPAALSIVKGNKMTQASEVVGGQLTLARQTALTRNKPVEVRFYQYADSEVPGESITDPSTWHFRAIQAFEVVKTGIVTPLHEVRQLPSGIILDSGSNLSSLLHSPSPAKGRDPIPRVGLDYRYSTIRFRPDGSVAKSTTSEGWFMTLHSLVDGDQLTSPPANLVTFEIDVFNGALKTFRPGLAVAKPAN